MSAPSGGAAPPLWRRLLPWLVAVLLLALALWRVDPGEVARHLGRVSLPAYAAFVGACLAVNLSLDSLASWRVYRLVAPTLRFRDLLVVRGASYLPGTINFHVGQAYLTFLLSRRHGAPVVSVAGATLLSYATFFGGVIAVTAVSLPFSHESAPWITGYVLPLLVAGVVYLAVLRLRPGLLAARAFLKPLFDAGPLRHVTLLLWRLPYVVGLVAGLWGAYAFFDVTLPFGPTCVLMPIILLVSALPITPQGLGARELVAIELLAPWAPEDDGQAAIVAAGAAWTVASMIGQVVVGLAFTPAGTRALAEPAEPSEPTGPSEEGAGA